MMRELDMNPTLSKREISLLKKRAFNLRWYYGILIPIVFAVSVVFSLWQITQNGAIVFVSAVILFLICSIIWSVCSRHALSIEMRFPNQTSIEKSQYTDKNSNFLEKDQRANVEMFWDLDGAKGPKRFDSKWFLSGLFISCITSVLFGNEEYVFNTVMKSGFIYFGLMFIVYTLGGRFLGISISSIRYQSELPKWVKALDKTIVLVGGHMLGFIAITFFRVFVMKDYV